MIEQCPICDNKGIAFHTAPSYKMSDFTDTFLHSKLWMKCEKCSNLYSRYFPTEFVTRNIEQKLIKFNPKYINDVTTITSYDLNNWCNILNKIKCYTDGKNMLEVEIGQGTLVATALAIGYEIDCVEI